MPVPAFTPTLAVAGVSLVALALSLRLRRKQRLLSDLPTSKTQGVFIGLVELCGTAESAAPLRSVLTATACVHYAYSVQEEWARTVVETYTDKDGRTQTRTRHESGWTTIAEGGETQDFFLRDDTGVVLVRPDRAALEPATVFDVFARPSDALYFAKGPTTAIADSTHHRRFIEQAIPLHAPLYVVGTARERADVVAAEIAHAKESPLFLISTRTEQSIQRSQAGWSWFWWAAGAVLAGIAGGLLHTRSAVAIAVGAYVALWGLTWTWMVFNSLIGLRARVRQAWSLIDVQLKRRHDLLPRLVAIVAGLRAHEQDTQTAIAALRTQVAATPPGCAGPDFAGVSAPLRAVIEKYPALVAEEGFTALHRALVDTEQRIALARTYYNDIATHFATRLERVPDRWVAGLVRMQPEPLLAAAGFERAPVAIAPLNVPS